MAYTADQVIQKAYLFAKMKATAPGTSTSKYAQLLSLVDAMSKEWQDTPGIDWNSRYDTVDIGTVSNTDEYELDETIEYVSKREGDYVRLISADGNNTKNIPLVEPNQLYDYSDSLACAQSGRNLIFSQPFDTTSQYIGYTIRVPGFTYLEDIIDGSQEVQVDDPLWLAYAVADLFAQHDVTKQDIAPGLKDRANDRMEKMLESNGGQLQQVTTNWNPLGSFDVW